MRLIPLVALALGAGLAAGATAAPGGSAPSPKAPPDFTLPKAESSPGTVTFSHARHMPNVEKCTRCHYRTFKMKRGAYA